MFLFAITKDGIAQNFQSGKVEEFLVHSSRVTIVTDNFLSGFFPESDGFSVVESPLIKSPNFLNIIFSKVRYNQIDDSLTVFKSTASGRPIYYHITSKGEFLCSTHISLLRLAGVRIEEHINVLPEFFIYRCVVPPQTLFKNIKQVIAGSKICFKSVNGKYKIFTMEEYNPPAPTKVSKKEYDPKIGAECTLNILQKSIKLLDPYSDSLGVILSGGLDSSILFKICLDTYGIKIAYSTGYPFEDPEKNTEKEYALSAADAFQAENNYYYCSTENYLRGFIEGICGAEEPLHHLQSVLLYLLFKEGIPKTKKIVVSGLGADGIFGTTAHSFVFAKEKIIQIPRCPFSFMLNLFTKKTKNDILNSFNNRLARIYNNSNILWSQGAYGYNTWVSQYFNASKEEIIKGRKNLINKYNNRSIYDKLSLLDFLRTSVTQTIWSKIGESTGKIIYYPFSNSELMNYSFSIPWEIKLKTPKHILRSVARQLEIPEFIITRPKSSFGIKSKIWMEKGGVFEPLIPLAVKVFDEKEIRKMQSVDSKKAMTYWNMLNYAVWKRICINNEPVEALLEELG